jgi:hypothetical protein
MEIGLIVLTIVLLGVALGNLFCLIFVLVKMYNEKGILHALLGFFCCTLYPFIWGWLNASRLKMYDIMIFWTAITVFGTILQVLFQLFGVAQQPQLFLQN